MGRVTRWLRHRFAPSARDRFPDASLGRIAVAIGEGEKLHDGEVVFAVEAALPAAALRAGASPRQRAQEAFSSLRVWDTRANNGVLLYLLLADRAIEIVADRGLHGQVSDAEWESVCAQIEAGLRAGDMEQAVIDGIGRISALLARYCPATDLPRDEHPDRPVLL